MGKAKELGSLIRMRHYLEKFVGDISSIGQTNLYFFRTRHIGQLTAGDRRLCEPIFRRLLEIAQPTLIIALSNSVSSGLLDLGGFSDGLESKSFAMNSRKQRFEAIRGKFSVPGADGRWIAVPHPATPCLTTVREAAWSFCLPTQR